MNTSPTGIYYGDYLRLDRLLSAQAPESDRLGRPAHDEMLFIVVHQAYELWFKQILYEMESVREVFARPVVDDRQIGSVVHTLHRIAAILKLVIGHLDVLETMTPLDFLDFRDLLYPSSGFQSLQFRLIEQGLGLRRDDRLDFDKKPFDVRLDETDRKRLRKAGAGPSLSDQIDQWLARTPFVELGGYRFQEEYRRAVDEMLERDAAIVGESPALDESGRKVQLDGLAAAQKRFAAIFDEKRHARQGGWRFTLKSLQAALFINLYRDEPALQLPFRMLSLLMDIDETLTAWRYRHALMVQRMIGMKLGTGGSSGHDYLRQTADRHRIFGDLFALSTFLIPRSALPPLPEAVRRAMTYRYAEDPEA
ncbi:MAG: tryptophan 2,3-dioxygenase [Inquilinus sp.]|nr:tryptophan 2,3-dioxygenase [Inquilinus sp.]